jgi:hypothetical protein
VGARDDAPAHTAPHSAPDRITGRAGEGTESPRL